MTFSKLEMFYPYTKQISRKEQQQQPQKQSFFPYH